MSVQGIDTLKLARRLRDGAGFTPEHAEAAAEAFSDALTVTDLVTKDHLELKLSEMEHRLDDKIAGVKAELKGEIGELRTEIAGVKAGLKGEISELRTEISGVKAELKGEITGLRTEFKAELRTEIAGLKADLTDEIARARVDMMRWGIGTVLTAVLLNAVVVVGSMWALSSSWAPTGRSLFPGVAGDRDR
ncbi:DUF1640 domain-containing protein [Pararhodospirillum photometricum]|uniref:DUF1640 domain-containing protein n=1 Tax=Pararhodospirillum photometricum DSM 122 TaxID=1150469 RepID=H6SLC1_PARPM|nr:DUF1640 domain-containing protein [Pararhodospirillum photometricum]CCG08786.1 Putative uncharacterized protein [Pararhodospirillum photometricum DSM 122]